MSKEEVDKRLKSIEKSRHDRINRCYMNTYNNTRKFNKYNNYNKQHINYNKGYNKAYNIREPITVEEVNVFKKDTVLKRPGTVLHLDRRF